MCLWKSNYIINVTMVNIETYSDTEDGTPAYATINVQTSGVSMFTNKTVFNIMSDNSLRLNETLNQDLMEDDEISKVLNSNIVFLVNRAGFTLKRMNVIAIFASTSTTVEAIRSTYNHEKTLSLISTYFQIQGEILMNQEVGTNLYFDYFEADVYATIEAIVYLIKCNFPEAVLNHTVVFKNMYVYNSQPRIINLFTTFQVTGDPNITLSNATWDVYGSSSEDVAPFEVQIEPDCLPQDSLTRYIQVDSNYVDLKENDGSDRFSGFYMEFSETTPRTEIITFENNIFENMPNSIYSMIDIYLVQNAHVTIKNNTFTNISGEYGVLYLYHIGTITITNNLIQN